MDEPQFDSLRVTASADRHLIPADEACVRYLLLKLRMPLHGHGQRPPVNVSLILDRSGSMQDAKLRFAKAAVVQALRQLDQKDRVSVVAYNEEVHLLAPSQPVTSEARAQLTKKVRSMIAGGTTNLSGGWFTGCDQIADHKDEGTVARAFLLTDGRANEGIVDEEELIRHARELFRRGITTSTFGVGLDFNQFLLQGIAEAGGGRFFYIERAEQIPVCFDSDLANVLETVVRELTLDVELPENVEISSLGPTLGEEMTEGKGSAQRLRLSLGNGSVGERRTILLELKLPPSEKGKGVTLSLRVRYEDPRQRSVVEVPCPRLYFEAVPADICSSQPPDEDVLRRVGRLEVERVKMRALRLENDGDLEGARDSLALSAQTLGTIPPALAAPLEQELDEMDQTIRGMTEKERKQLHYDAYRI